MNKEYSFLMLSELIAELQNIKNENGDLYVGFEDDESYTNRCKIKTTENGDMIIDLSR
jgi:hypothetical protein